MGTRPGEASDEANKDTVEKQHAVTEELRDLQDRLTGATAALLVALREAGKGPWETGSGPTEEALLGWLEEQIYQMEDLKESMDQKRRELTGLKAGKLGSLGRGRVVRQDSNRPGERSHGEVEDRFREQDVAAKESKEGGTKGIRALMALPNPEGALGARVVM